MLLISAYLTTDKFWIVFTNDRLTKSDLPQIIPNLNRKTEPFFPVALQHLTPTPLPPHPKESEKQKEMDPHVLFYCIKRL